METKDTAGIIERLEAASGPDRSLDWEIHLRDGLEGVGAYGQQPHYTSSIDMALMLVPEGFGFSVSNRAPAPHKGRAAIHNKELHFRGMTASPNPKLLWFEATALTPAIALCIAALRARAQGE